MGLSLLAGLTKTTKTLKLFADVTFIEVIKIKQCSYTPWAKHIFLCKFVINQRISMPFSLLDLEMNETCVSMNLTYLT